MAFNQVSKFKSAYASSVGHIGNVIAGITMLNAYGSTNISGICVDLNSNIYATDSKKHIILKITESGIITVLAGLSDTSGNNGSSSVTCANARFNYPTGICCDKNGDIYVCDTNNHQIRKISNNMVSLVAGAATPTSGTNDGAWTTARFNKPYDIDINKSGVLYVADTFNHAIRQIKSGTVTTFAGLKGTAGNKPEWSDMVDEDGITGVDTRFDAPYALSCHPNGSIFVSDTNNYVIKKIDAGANVRIFSGSGVYGTTIGAAKTCRYQYLKFSDVDRSGDLFVIDYNEGGTSRLIRVNAEGTSAVVIDFSTIDGKYVTSIACMSSGNMAIAQSEYMIEEFSSSSSSYVENWSSSSESSASSYSSSSSSYVENWSSSSESLSSASSSSSSS